MPLGHGAAECSTPARSAHSENGGEEGDIRLLLPVWLVPWAFRLGAGAGFRWPGVTFGLQVLFFTYRGPRLGPLQQDATVGPAMASASGGDVSDEAARSPAETPCRLASNSEDRSLDSVASVRGPAAHLAANLARQRQPGLSIMGIAVISLPAELAWPP